ncbi:sensor histidine kinase [Chloroflexota bacterium]
MMTTDNSPEAPKIKRDLIIFIWFRVFVVVGVYAFWLINEPTVRQIEVLIPFTILTLLHILFYWQMGRLATSPMKILGYIILQGLLAFTVSIYIRDLILVFLLFMVLFGEAIGLYRLSRKGFLAMAYYLILMVISMVQSSGWDSTRSFLFSMIPIMIVVLLFTTLYMRQNAARLEAQSLASDLEIANRQLVEYAHRVEDLTIANERQRVARDLHDTLSQDLAGLILQLEAADVHIIKNKNDKAQLIVADAMQQARSALSNARLVIGDLRKLTLKDMCSALRAEISRFTNNTGIPINFHLDQIPLLPDPVKDALIRTLSEALTNVEQHAGAQNVEVIVKVNEQRILVSIEDDGQGFDSLSIPPGHFGIMGIKELVRLVNGSFEIQSQEGKGTLLTIRVPL